MEHIEAFFGNAREKEMVADMKNNTSTYINYFTEVIFQHLPARNVPVKPEDLIKRKFENILNNHRFENIDIAAEEAEDGGASRPENERLPIEVLKKFTVSIVYGTKSAYETLSIRNLKSEKMGSLVAVKAIVVRASDVKPEIVLATYNCDACGFENYQQVNGKEFTPIINCTSRKCKENKTTGKLVFNTSGSKFVAYQELKIQETSEQLVEGSIPRTFLVQLNGSFVRKASPGDVVEIQGILLPNRRTGFKHKSDIIFDGYIEAHKITREKKKYVEFAMTARQIDEIESMRGHSTDDQIFTRLANSIAPEIFGMETVKKALLLLMVGGVGK